jgi:hypothetical protein
MAVACHPSQESDVSTLKSLPIANKRGEVDRATLKQLSKIVKDHNVCGVLVSWPLQEGTGKMGAACGRVLHTLEDLLLKQQQLQTDSDSSSSSAPVITPTRPICFWNYNHVETESADEWGRNSSYAVSEKCPSDSSVHLASKEQYYQDENVAAAQVWNDFSRVHWPALYEKNQKKQCLPSKSRNSNTDDASWSKEENWNDIASYNLKTAFAGN